MIAPEQRCPNVATHRRFWPGREPDLVCRDHQTDTLEILRACGVAATFEVVGGGACACSAGRAQHIVIGTSALDAIADAMRAVTDRIYPRDWVCSCGWVAHPLPGTKRVTCERCPPGARDSLFRLRIPLHGVAEGCVACSAAGTDTAPLAEYDDGENYPTFCARCLRVALALVENPRP